MSNELDKVIQKHVDLTQPFDLRFCEYHARLDLVEGAMIDFPQTRDSVIDEHARRLKSFTGVAPIIGRVRAEYEACDDVAWLLAGEDVTQQIITQRVRELAAAENQLAGEQWWADQDQDEGFIEHFNN